MNRTLNIYFPILLAKQSSRWSLLSNETISAVKAGLEAAMVLDRAGSSSSQLLMSKWDIWNPVSLELGNWVLLGGALWCPRVQQQHLLLQVIGNPMGSALCHLLCFHRAPSLATFKITHINFEIFELVEHSQKYFFIWFGKPLHDTILYYYVL